MRSTEGNYYVVRKDMWEKLMNVDDVATKAEEIIASSNSSDADKRIASRYLEAWQRGKSR